MWCDPPYDHTGQTTARGRLEGLNLFVDYHRDADHVWWALTGPMTSKQSETPGAHHLDRPERAAADGAADLERGVAYLLHPYLPQRPPAKRAW